MENNLKNPITKNSMVIRLIGCALLVFAFLVCVGCSLVGKEVVTYRDLEGREHAIQADYENTQQSLTDYYTKTKNALGIADANARSLKDIFTTAMGPHSNGNFAARDNVVYQQIHAAYPQVGSITTIYEKVHNTMTASYDDYSSKVGGLRDAIRAYRTDLDDPGTALAVPLLNVFGQGFPSHRLSAQIKGQPVYGDDALKVMERVIQDPDAAQSLDTGTLQPIFQTPAAKPNK